MHFTQRQPELLRELAKPGDADHSDREARFATMKACDEGLLG